MPQVPPQQNVTDYNTPVSGWMSAPNDRGSIDILWSCCITILLCCWVSTYPNAASPNDKWYHRFVDKFNLAMIGLLGPDFLFGIALGQVSSARRSVKAFERDKHLCKGTKWTYRHAFYTDMGGIFLTSPDFPEGFPINAEQLHYLVKNDHVEFPDMEAMCIDERNSADTLSRLLTVWQVFWFTVEELQRARDGLPMTTLELTAMSFVFVMIMTTICWFRKPSITRPRSISTKNGKTTDEIRAAAKQSTHPHLDSTWYRTPVDFVGGHRWRIEAHWSFYARFSHSVFHLRIVSRSITSRPWDRFPSDMWLPPEMFFVPIGAAVIMFYSSSFLIAWNFYFPTSTEKLLWRALGTYHAVFVVYGGCYYLIEGVRWKRRRKRERREGEEWGKPWIRVSVSPEGEEASESGSSLSVDTEAQGQRFSHRIANSSSGQSSVQKILSKADSWMNPWRNISVDQDPEMAVPLRIIVPVTVTCVIYVFCRLYLYVEDFVSLRTQPVGIYYTVNRFIPFMGN